MLVGYVIPISPNLHYFSIWFVCIFNHPTTFFSVLSNFLTSVVSCVTHSLGCEVVSRVNGSLSLFATCTAFSTPPPPRQIRSFVRSLVRSFLHSFVCLHVGSFLRSFVRLFALRSANQSSGRLFAELLFRAVFCFSSLTFFFVWRLVYSLFCGWFYYFFFLLVCTSLTCSTSLL